MAKIAIILLPLLFAIGSGTSLHRFSHGGNGHHYSHGHGGGSCKFRF